VLIANRKLRVSAHKVGSLSGEVFPRPCHFEKLIPLLSEGRAFGKLAALLRVLSIFRRLLHGPPHIFKTKDNSQIKFSFRPRSILIT